MRTLRRSAAFCIVIGLSLFMTACGGSTTPPPPPPTTYVLTVESTTNPASAMASAVPAAAIPASGPTIGVSPADINGATSGSAPFTLTYNPGTSVTLIAPATWDGDTFVSWSGCASTSTVTCAVTMNTNTTVTANYAVPVAYVLTVNSTNPASGVTIAVSAAGANGPTSGTTSFGLTELAGTTLTLTAPATAGGNTFASWTGCASTSTVNCTVTVNANMTVTANYTVTPTVTVTPSSSSISTAQALSVTVAVSGGSGNPTPTGTVTLTSGSYTSAATTLSSGGATINIPAGSLAAGSDILKVTYTPDANSSSTYTSASGTNSVTVTVFTPTVTVTPASSSITTAQALSVTIAVSGGSGNPTPTGSVVLTSGSYASAATTLSSGGATINVPAGSLAVGSDALKVTYTPDSASSPIYNGNTGTNSVTVTALTPTVTVTPASSSITTAQALSVTIAVSGGSGNPTPTGSVVLTSGSYTSAAATLSSGGATINVPAGSLATGSDTLTVTYTPDSASSSIYNGNTGTSSVTVTLPAKTTPTVTVTPSSLSISTAQALSVTVAVSGGSGNPVPTGSVTLTSGSYTSAAATLSSGSAQIDIQGGSLAAGSDTLQATYTPDSASSSLYNTATGTSAAVTVTAASTITVNQANLGPAVTDQLIGMNMAVWNDTTLAEAVSPFQAVGVKAVRWPGGSTSDLYHWEGASSNPSSPTLCDNGYANPNDTFADFVNDLAVPAGLDIALTANYGSNEACNGGGEPSEAAAWVANALTLGVTVSHMTVGNEVYGASWEYDLHTPKNDPTTYAAAVGNSASSGYYEQIKTASPHTLVGVVVDAGSPSYGGVITADWDPIVLANSQYDFVEYHYYPQNPGDENDTSLVHSAAQGLTTGIKTIKAELNTAGNPDTPIYVGEMGSVSSNPGKQSWSITQGLFAGQMLGEMMNDGVSRATWWIGFGNCNGTGTTSDPANLSASLYGWQDFGAYNVFSDGSADSTCPGAGPLGTLSPTAVAFQLFSDVAVTGENALTATVAGDTADVRAYAATHSGGTALVLFNLNKTTSEPVTITLSGQTTASTVTMETYDKATYDLSGSPTGFFPDPAGTSTWAPPFPTTITSPTLPLTLTLTPWSMNVVIIH